MDTSPPGACRMSAALSHPERLLIALDEALDHEVSLILYGRSAIWLGFENPPPAAATTQDLDAIIPNEQVQALANDFRFWDARDAVNERFKSEGLYITHLFPERNIFAPRMGATDRCDQATAVEPAEITSACND